MRLTLDLFGVVQGVGLRPTVQRLADEAGLGGWIENRSGSVRLCLLGPEVEVESFVAELPSRLLPPARIERLERREVEPEARSGPARFEIRPSVMDAGAEIVIPADLAVCPACLAEVMDPRDRRFGYPFTTCTLCGPRFTVVNGTPYDRVRTTLATFALCAACRREYENPRDRRFHAESIACPECGPQLSLWDSAGRLVPGDPLRLARAALARGEILALRGIGGFLLAADALNRSTLARLRQRKHRPHKPFAVMAVHQATVERYCRVPEVAAETLASPVSPILILDAKTAAGIPIDLLTPDSPTLGIMLPTSPLHHLLGAGLAGDPVPPFELLVMTSGNRAGEPICTTNEEALVRLRGIADLFLAHDREIYQRCDDSVCTVQNGAVQVLRRARGVAPAPIRVEEPLARRVLAMGAELKNTVAVGFGRSIVLSPHIGDLETPGAVAALERACRELPRFLRQEPEVIAVDLHPDMQSTRLGRTLAAERDLPLITVQHHHAHAVACMTEHRIEEALALVYDGTGLGEDGAIWGAELLHVTPVGYTRLGTFAGVPLPGGDAAVREPARQLVARLWDAGLELPVVWQRRLDLTEEHIQVWRQQCGQRLNAPISHAAGRLFDAVAAAVGVAPRRITYEAQAAVRLESAARLGAGWSSPLPFATTVAADLMLVDWRPTFAALTQNDTPAGELALAFHRALADAAKAMARYGRERTGLARIVLTGGVFTNRILAGLVPDLLESDGFVVHCHRHLPPNDGAVAVGQAVVAGS